MKTPYPIRRGTNISHWLSQSTARGDARRARFTRDDARRLADLGFDHLRLPVDEVQLWDATGRREPEAWELLLAALDWCRQDGLGAIVDLHILRTHFFNQPATPELFTQPAAAERFAALWEELSAVLQTQPLDRVAYEFLNEPIAAAAADWNRVSGLVYERLRAREPQRLLVLGSNGCNSVTTFGALQVPPGDPRLLLTFHYYDPLLITHHRAPWCEPGRLYAGPIQYPGRPIPDDAWQALPEETRRRLAAYNQPHDAAAMERALAQPLAVAARTGLPLYCGEFGVLETVPEPIRAAWCRDLRAVLERHGIAWANWDFRGGFGLFRGAGTPSAVLDALRP